MKQMEHQGRVIQVIQALGTHDAVSNHVLQLDDLVRRQLRLKAEIYSEWSTPDLEHRRRHIRDLYATEQDVVILHFSGYAPVADRVARSRAAKILLYHNITPSHYFEPGDRHYTLCEQGRNQLAQLIGKFDYYSGVSNYNLRELASLGVVPGDVIPIVVENPPAKIASQPHMARHWLFVGRVCEHKRQDKLVDLFAKYLETHGGDCHLDLVGPFDRKSRYVAQVRERIAHHGLEDRVHLHGEVSPERKHAAYSRADVFVCASEHEGFGVGFIEAGHYDLPVVALAHAAIPETLKGSPGVVSTDAQWLEVVTAICAGRPWRDEIIEAQRKLLDLYRPAQVAEKLRHALSSVLTDPDEIQSVSIVICTFNRADFLARCLDYLQHQTNPNFEVVVVNGPSTDNTEEVLKAYEGRIKVGRTDKRNLSVSRNIGIELASGDVVAFIDDDAVPYDDWVDVLLRAYRSSPRKVGGLGGPTLYAGSFDFQVRDIALNAAQEDVRDPTQAHLEEKGFVRHLLGTNATFRREVLLEVGGFDEQYDYFLDESDLAWRVYQAGHTLAHIPDGFVRHEFARSENRVSKYDYNWNSIVKNTVYFVLHHNTGRTHEENIEFLRRKIIRERIRSLQYALTVGEISRDEYTRHSDRIWAGYEQGIADAERGHRIRPLVGSTADVLSFAPSSSHPLAGVDIRPMHVCLVTQELVPFQGSGGNGYQLSNLAAELLQAGHRVTVVMRSDKRDTFTRGRFTLHFVPTDSFFEGLSDTPIVQKNINWGCTAAAKVMEIHRQMPIDIVDSTIWDFETFPLAALKEKLRIPLAVRLVTPIVIANRTNDWDIPKPELDLIRDIERDVVQSADLVIPISDTVATTFEKEYAIKRDKRWQRSYIGVRYWPQFDVHSNYDELNDKRLSVLPEDTIKVLFVGRLEGRKGADVLIDAAHAVLSKAPDRFSFIVAGVDHGKYERLAKKKLGPLFDRMVFLGWVSDETKEKLLSMADVLAFPSRYESFGIVPLEGFVHGTPTIGARAGAVPEVVQDGKSGLLFEDGNAQDMAQKILQLDAEPELLKKLSRGAKKRIHDLSSRKMGLETISLYAKAIWGITMPSTPEEASSSKEKKRPTSATKPAKSRTAAVRQ